MSCIVQARPATVSDCFVENTSYALELVQMPASEENVSKFFAGVPPLLQREEEEEEEGEEGGEEGEGGRLHPPKAKRSKSEEKALNVSSLRVSTCRLSLKLHVLTTPSPVFFRNTESSLAMPGLPI